jgi:hypothetical protein
MRVQWLVAKYMSDLRRRETANVGVILLHGERGAARFIGQKEDGSFDGRSMKWLTSAPNYKAWVAFWQHSLQTKPFEGIISDLTAGRPDDNYRVEFGGERIIGTEACAVDDLLDELYGILVEDSAARSTQNVQKLAESVLARLSIADRVERGFKVEQPKDVIVFDYRFDNGQTSLMQRVSLNLPDERSWDSAHAAAWAFQKCTADGRQMIALVRPRSEDRALHQQLECLAEVAKVVDLSEEVTASERLAGLLHL